MNKRWMSLLVVPALAACAPTQQAGTAETQSKSPPNLNGRWTGQFNSPDLGKSFPAVMVFSQQGNQLTARLTFPDYSDVYNLHGTLDSGRLMADSGSAAADFTGFFTQNTYRGNFDLVFSRPSSDLHITGSFNLTHTGR